MARIGEVIRSRLTRRLRPLLRPRRSGGERPWAITTLMLAGDVRSTAPPAACGAGLDQSGLLDPGLVALVNRRVAAINGCVF